MSDRVFGITSRDRLLTVDDVPIEQVVADTLIPLVSRYNADADKVDYRGLLCTNDDTRVIQYNIPTNARMDALGPHEIPYYVADKRGAYQQFVRRWGNAVGFDYEFYRLAKKQDYVDKVLKRLAFDKNRIRYQIIKAMLNPTEYGHGFWNRTFAAMEGISSPPDYGMNSFTASHTM